MSETIQFTKNRLQTNVAGGVPSVGYQFRMGYVADANSHFATAVSSIVMSEAHGANQYGMQFDNYKPDTDSAEFNYLTTAGTTNNLNLFTINNINTDAKATLNIYNTQAHTISTNFLSAGTAFIGSLEIGPGGIKNRAGTATESVSTNNLSSGNSYLAVTHADTISTIYLSAGQAFIGSLEIGPGGIKNPNGNSLDNISTNLLSSGQNYLGVTHADTISTVYLSAGQAFIGTLEIGPGGIKNSGTTAMTTISTNFISSGQNYFGVAEANTISTNYLSAGIAFIGSLEIGPGGIKNSAGTASQSISTIYLSSGDNYLGVTHADTISTNYLSAGIAYIGSLEIGPGGIKNLAGNALGNISTNFLSSGQSYLALADAAQFNSDSISTIYLSSGKSYLDVVVANDLTTTTFTTTSDQRLKTNVAPITGALEKLMKLNPVYYDWINHKNMHPGFPEVGFLAQQVAEVIPNIVAIKEDEMGTNTMGYDRLTAVLTAAMKELNTRVTAIEARLA